MKILFVMRYPFMLKNFTAGLAHLKSRGHEIEILFSLDQTGRVGEQLADEAALELPGVKMTYRPPKRRESNEFTKLLATALDMRRYDDKVYDDAPRLRSRARLKNKEQPGLGTLLFVTSRLDKMLGAKAVSNALYWHIEHSTPDTDLVEMLRVEKPDLMIVTPLTPIGSEQSIYIRAAIAAKVPVVYSMYSWDNLTNKGLLRPIPDFAVVWNEMHVDEATRMHGLRSGQVYAAGAPGYDIWFDQKPSIDFATFCQQVGLSAENPFLLYVCSSAFVGGDHERKLVERWLAALRAHSDPNVSRLGVLIRPHPQFTKNWQSADVSAFGNVVIYPREGEIPFSGDARAHYFDAIYHCKAVVGINTSAMVEAAIIGRPVMTIADPGHRDTQEGTLHFRHLAGYGFLQQAGSVEENLDQLSALAVDDGHKLKQIAESNRRFVAHYIRPAGVDSPAAVLWANAIEQIAQQPLPTRHSVFRSLLANAFLASCFPLLPVRAKKEPQKKKRKRSKWWSRKARKKEKRTTPVQTTTPAIKSSKPPRKQKPRREGVIGVKDLRSATGPFKPLTQLHKAFHKVEAAPETLILGDSVHYRVSHFDDDISSLAQMIECKLSGREEPVCINFSAYHPGVYLALLECLAKFRGRPKRLVLPINLRSFSPQWWLNPELQYSEDIALLRRYQPGEEIPEIIRDSDSAALDIFDATRARFRGSPIRKMGTFRRLALAKPLKTDLEWRVAMSQVLAGSHYPEWLAGWRARQIAILHYLYFLEPSHPRIKETLAAMRLAKELGIRPLIYVTPINYCEGVRAAGRRFTKIVRRNREVLAESSNSGEP